MKKNRLFLMGLALTAGLLFTACSSTDDEKEPAKTENPSEIEGEKKSETEMQLGQADEFIVNEDSCEVKTDYCTVSLTPTVVSGDTKLYVAKAVQAPYIISETDQMTVVDIKVDGSEKELMGVAEIRVPLTLPSSESLVAARYDSSTKAWVAAHCEYDNTKGEAIIYTDKPGTFGLTTANAASTRSLTRGAEIQYGAFLIGRADTREAFLYEDKFAYVDYLDPSLETIDKMVDHLAYAYNPDAYFTDLMAKDVIDHNDFYCQLGWESLKEFGFESDVIDKYANYMGRFASAALFYQKMRALIQGKPILSEGEKLKAIYDVAKDQVTSVLGTSALSLAMVSVAIIDYSLNKFAEEAWNGREEMYKKAFDLYYQKGNEGYCSHRGWFELIYPKFVSGMSAAEVNAFVESEVNKYCNKFWENESTIAYYFHEANGAVWTGGGGLNESIKSNLSGELRSIVYNDFLKPVFSSISHKMQEQQFELMKEQMKAYAKYMNNIVTLTIIDKSASDTKKSVYEGCTIRVKDLPTTMKDKDNWGCQLNEKGEGSIKFRMFALLEPRIKPVLEIISADEKVLKVVTVEKLNLEKNVIDIAGEEMADIKEMIVMGSITAALPPDQDGVVETMALPIGMAFNSETSAKFVTEQKGKALYIKATGTNGFDTSTTSSTHNLTVTFYIDDVNAISSGKAVIKDFTYHMDSKIKATVWGITQNTDATAKFSVPSLPMDDGFNTWKLTVGEGLQIKDYVNTSISSVEGESGSTTTTLTPAFKPEDYLSVIVLFKDK